MQALRDAVFFALQTISESSTCGNVRRAAAEHQRALRAESERNEAIIRASVPGEAFQTTEEFFLSNAPAIAAAVKSELDKDPFCFNRATDASMVALCKPMNITATVAKAFDEANQQGLIRTLDV